jgi:hypothetical protein
MIRGKPYELLPVYREDIQPYSWGCVYTGVEPVHLLNYDRFTTVCGFRSNTWYHLAQYRDVNILPNMRVCDQCLATWTLLQM